LKKRSRKFIAKIPKVESASLKSEVVQLAEECGRRGRFWVKRGSGSLRGKMRLHGFILYCFCGFFPEIFISFLAVLQIRIKF
jgi:hypothetical protein